jgi:hypothetical protein
MRVARDRLLRNVAGSLGVLLTLAVIAIGLPAVDRTVPSLRAVPPHVPYEVGGGVTVVPPPRAMLDVTRTRPSTRQGTVLFRLDAVRYVIVVAPFDGDLSAATDRLRRKILNADGHRLVGTDLTASTGTGLPGREGIYTAPDREGRYAVFLAPGVSIEVTVSGTAAELSGVEHEITASTASIAYVGEA